MRINKKSAWDKISQADATFWLIEHFQFKCSSPTYLKFGKKGFSIFAHSARPMPDDCKSIDKSITPSVLTVDGFWREAQRFAAAANASRASFGFFVIAAIASVFSKAVLSWGRCMLETTYFNASSVFPIAAKFEQMMPEIWEKS